MSEADLRFFAAAPRSVAPLLSAELRDMGLQGVERTGAGASFGGCLADGYRAVLWSRVASRVSLQLARVDASSADSLYEGIHEMAWEEHLRLDGTLAVNFHGTSAQIRNSHFGALRVKDAIVDRLRDKRGTRPSVDLERPDLRVDVHLYRGGAVVGIDLSGGGLHRRGYRVESTDAPLRETLAAAILLRAGWPQIAADGGGLVDPMCGSGTFLIEAAWMAQDRAPAWKRDDLGLLRWAQHSEGVWQGLVDEATQRAEAGMKSLPTIRGFDADVRAVRASLANLEQAGLAGRVHVERRPVADPSPAVGAAGLLVSNPPYGHRLGGESSVRALHAELTTRVRTDYGGWRAAILTTTPEWARSLGIRALPDTFANGALECRLLLGDVPAAGQPETGATADSGPSQRSGPASDSRYADRSRPAPSRKPADQSNRGEARPRGESHQAPTHKPAAAEQPASAAPPGAVSEGAQMFANRLRKNLRTIGKWARRAGIQCYRLYDADMPEYALAIDVYHGAEMTWAHVQEYRAPAGIDPGKAATRLQEALSMIPEVLDIPAARLHFKVRERKRGSSQYQRRGGTGGTFHEITEGPCTFLVNFTDYLDTGLFLDHRPTRMMIGEMAQGKRFLNLFGYTGTATAHASLGGARSTVTVDMSQTYLDWAIRNFERNGMSGSTNRVEQADCLQWLDRPHRERFDLIFLDPPTFSNSKRMEQDSFDVQRDHAGLIHRAGKLLTADGVLLFSTNFRRFRLDEGGLTGWRHEDITRQTLPRDFERNQRIHQCHRITRA